MEGGRVEARRSGGLCEGRQRAVLPCRRGPPVFEVCCCNY